MKEMIFWIISSKYQSSSSFNQYRFDLILEVQPQFDSIILRIWKSSHNSIILYLDFRNLGLIQTYYTQRSKTQLISFGIDCKNANYLNFYICFKLRRILVKELKYFIWRLRINKKGLSGKTTLLSNKSSLIVSLKIYLLKMIELFWYSELVFLYQSK